MAITNINLSDAVSTWVTKTNTIATNVGDIALLNQGSNLVAGVNNVDSNVGTLSSLSTTDKSDLVSAINEVQSAASAALVRSRFQEGIGLNFDSANGTLSAELATTRDSIGDTGKNAGIGMYSSTHFTVSSDSALVELADSAVSSAKLRGAVRFRIYNSTGGTLKDLYGAGS